MSDDHGNHPDFEDAAKTAHFAFQRLTADDRDAEQTALGLMAGAVAAYISVHGESALPAAMTRIRNWCAQVEQINGVDDANG